MINVMFYGAFNSSSDAYIHLKNFVMMGSDNGLSPVPCWAIIWTNVYQIQLNSREQIWMTLEI